LGYEVGVPDCETDLIATQNLLAPRKYVWQLGQQILKVSIIGGHHRMLSWKLTKNMWSFCCIWIQQRYPRFQDENLERNKVLYERVANLAKKYNCTPGQLALSWVIHQGNDVVPIPGLFQA